MPQSARSVSVGALGSSQFGRSKVEAGASRDVGLGGIPGGEVASAGRKAGIGRRFDRRLNLLSMQRGAATGTPHNVDAQQDTHPVGGRAGLFIRCWRSRSEQLAAPSQLLPLDAIRQQAVMPDAQEVVWKHVLQETAEEFLGRKDIRLQAVAIAAIPVVVMDLAALATQDAVVADGHSMRVTSEVIQQLARPGKRERGICGRPRSTASRLRPRPRKRSGHVHGSGPAVVDPTCAARA